MTIVFLITTLVFFALFLRATFQLAELRENKPPVTIPDPVWYVTVGNRVRYGHDREPRFVVTDGVTEHKFDSVTSGQGENRAVQLAAKLNGRQHDFTPYLDTDEVKKQITAARREQEAEARMLESAYAELDREITG